MKRITLLIIVCVCCLSVRANTTESLAAESVVRDFFYNISQWFEYGKSKNMTDRAKSSMYKNNAIGLTIGLNDCHVDDKLTELNGKGKAFVADWMLFFKKDMIEGGCSLHINIIRYDCTEERITTTGGGIWVYADVTFYYGGGSVRIFDYLRVLDNKICYIDREGSKLHKAREYYKQKNYDAAFPIFQEISLKSPYEFEAQYYAVVMLTLKQGCKNMDKDQRKYYAVKYSYNGYVKNNKPLADLYLKFYYQWKPSN